jgi:hypothetical protein
MPNKLGSAIVIVGDAEHEKWAFMECPCQCGDVIEVNLMRSHPPFWQVSSDQLGRVTFAPSLWRASGTCGSHFLVRKNKVIWVNSRLHKLG